MTQTNKPSWENNLRQTEWFGGFGEPYWLTTPNLLKPFIENIIQSERSTLLQEIADEVWELYQDAHPVDDSTGESVETYGYEETHNRAIHQVLTIIKSKQNAIYKSKNN